MTALTNGVGRLIHLEFRSGLRHLLGYLDALEDVGVNHVALNLCVNRADIETAIRCLADELLSEYSR